MNAIPQARAGRREWIGLAVLLLPTLVVAMDVTVLHLAVPSLSAQLKPSSAQLLWIVDVYGFLVAGSLITMGTLGDRIGRRRLLLIGGAAFGVASVLAAFATDAAMLIAARALLGVAGATLMPSTLALIRNMFHDPRQRTVAIGIWVSGFSGGSAIGPLVGGLLLAHFWWGSVFLLAVPVMALLLALGPVLLPEYRDPNAGRLDLVSAALSLVAVLAVIFGFKQIAQDGLAWLPALSIGTGLAVGGVFIRRQMGRADPLLDLRLFADRAFSASLITYTLAVFVFFGALLFVAQYLQLVIGLSPFEAGLWTAPAEVVFIITSNLAPRLVRRVRPVLLLLTRVGVASLPVVVAAWILMSFGAGLAFTLVFELIVGTAPPERAGAASALSETGAELGGALGLAILGSIGLAVYRGGLTVPAGVPAAGAAAARDTLGGAVTVAGQFPDALGVALLGSAQAAFVQGLQLMAVVGAVVMTGLAVLMAVQLRHLPARGGSEAEAALEPEGLAA